MYKGIERRNKGIKGEFSIIILLINYIMPRSFTVEAIYKSGKKSRISGGRYISEMPSAAAHKAFSQAYRSMRGKGAMTLEIHIRETTSRSAHKTYKYKVSKKATSKDVERGGENIHYSYYTKVKAI
jgi:hypothetical protein|uniref:Uncharacterized protein n=1 Tax=viral metagenome TaxID=1070528 RepID=A0A6C0DV56_9ZZZZ